MTSSVRARDGNGFGRLHVLTDPDGPLPVLHVVDEAIAAGVPVVQIRSKAGPDRDRFALVTAVVDRCRAAGATAIVDDRVDLALAGGADGVHLGATDLPVEAARTLGGKDLLIGATVRNESEAAAAEADGADYVGIGPTFATGSKSVDHEPLGAERVGAVAASISLPSVAIAGVTAAAVPELVDRGVTGVAVIGAVSRASDPRAACTELLDALEAAP